MGLGNYVAACDRLAAECLELPTREEIALLREHLAGGKSIDLFSWMSLNREDVADFVKATPSQRAKKRVWRDNPLQRTMLCLAAYHQLKISRDLLDAVDLARLYPGGPYREMANAAGAAWWRISDALAFEWPWPDPSPWVE